VPLTSTFIDGATARPSDHSKTAGGGPIESTCSTETQPGIYLREPFHARMRGACFFGLEQIPAKNYGVCQGFGVMGEFIARPPKDLNAAGRAFWRSVLSDFEPNSAELQLLHEACRTKDELDVMVAAVAAESPVVAGSKGQPRPHPLLAEIRQHRRLLDQLVVALGMPLESEVVGRRRSAAAKQNADARWRKSGPRRKGRLASVQTMTTTQEGEHEASNKRG